MISGSLDDLARRRSLRRWRRVVSDVDRMDPGTLANLRKEAGQERQILDQALSRIDSKLTAAARPPAAPGDSDWIWRPEVFTSRLAQPGFAGIASGAPLGESAKMFHDCSRSEITLRQTTGRAYAASAPYGLAFDVLQFEGSFLSLVIDLPPAATEGLTLSHIVHVSLQVQAEKEIEIFARLNVKHGPNTEQVVREVDMRHSSPELAFDLAYTALEERRIEAAWIDIIFGNPAMNRVELTDLVISRHLRAEM